MKKSIEEKLRYSVENHKLNYEIFFGKGCKWYHHYFVVDELVWSRNFCGGYEIFVYDNEHQNEHIATFIVDYIPNPKGGYCLIPRLKTYYLSEMYA